MKITLNNLQDVFGSKKASIETMTLKGYSLIEEIFVDNSGLGSPDEPAFTPHQFLERLTHLVADNQGTVYTSITNQGQFQVYVGIFKKSGKKTDVRKVANNTLEYVKDNKVVIRFHDTDILVIEDDAITLDNGGFFTDTTKERINLYIKGYGYFIYQKAFTWYVKNLNTLESIEYRNGMVLKAVR